ncbi:HTH-type transcriptional regulator BhcR [Cochlodiniinecator piscidefendens]|uniref:HTH-type transcriptional regulator BhcR n=1 Tax=Cochlodiniinecator piscidefendens TaxID=2715756 RepID=UPI00140C1375|nr:HTH-type transcriptional regulator BhcR [Cochlodiniinecator piscidefendens]
MSTSNRNRGRPKGFSTNASQNTIQSLDRAIDVLETLAETNGLTLTEIAKSLDQSAATMYRVLSTFQAREFVEFDTAEQTWHIGPNAFRIGSSFLRSAGILERSRPIMRTLMETTGETANLGIERNSKVMFIGQVETQETIRAFFAPGTRTDMHSSGIGKVLLSLYNEDQLARYLRDTTLTQYTRKTITSPDVLRSELIRIRAHGVSFDDEEKTDGMRCIAAPIVNNFGEAVAGISVSGPSSRMTPAKIKLIRTQVRDAAFEIFRRLGSHPET